MKKHNVLVAVIVLAALGIAAYYYFGSSKSGAVTFRTARIERGQILRVVRATGILNPVVTVQVGSQISGTIARLNADFNSVVKQGDVIALIDDTFLKAALNESLANLEGAAARRQDAERTYNRSKELYSRSLISQSELDATTASFASARASEKQTRAAVERARVNLRYATITAPVSGTVISRNVDVGQTVAASLSAPTIFTIAKDLRQMNILASIDEADIGAIKEGQTVNFTVDAYPNKRFHGVVSQIRLAPVTVQNVVTYTVVVDVNNSELLLKPGMTATLTVEIDRRDDVLKLPMLALKMQLDTAGTSEEKRTRGPKPANVYLLENNQPKKVQVTLGLNDGMFAEILDSTLQDGQEVIIGTDDAGAKSSAPQPTASPFSPQQQQQRGAGGGGRRNAF